MKNYHRRGYITLMSVLVIGAVGSAIAASVVLGGLGASRMGSLVARSVGARALADACAEEALLAARRAPGYSGSDTLALGDGSCTYVVAPGVGSDFAIEAQGFLGSIIRKVRIDASAESSTITVASWREVADF